MRKLLVFLLLVPAFCFGQPQLNMLLNKYMLGEHEQGFNGDVLVAQNGKIIYQNAFGYSNFSTKQLLNNSSVFELASLSKQFTAVAIMMLKEQGKLTLSDTLGKLFPELPYSKVSIYQLLTHTSGLPDYQDAMDDVWDHHKIAFNQDVVRFLAEHRPALEFTPGSRYAYSNTGYVLLAAIIEHVSGLSYNEYLKRNIFMPLHMNRSRVYNSRRSKHDIIANYAYGYVPDNKSGNYVLPDSLKQYDFVHWLDGVTGDGTVNSMTGDLLKWEQALLNHRLLNAEDQKEMLSPHTLADTSIRRYYGFGVELGADTLGRFISHNGFWPGYSTVLTHYLKGGYTLIVLSNNQYNTVGVSTALAHILNGLPVVMPYQHKEVALDTDVLKRYVGSYTFPAKIELLVKAGKLYRHLPGRRPSSDVELNPESATKFFYANKSDIQLEFELSVKGEVSKVFVINCGVRTEGFKISKI